MVVGIGGYKSRDRKIGAAYFEFIPDIFEFWTNVEKKGLHMNEPSSFPSPHLNSSPQQTLHR